MKKDGLSNPTKASLSEAFKCSECLHFKQTPHRSNPQVCEVLGVRRFAIAPKCFTPDYTKVVGNADEFLALAQFFGSRTSEQKKILLGMLRQKPSGKKYPMGTKLYLKISNRDYISNYLCGFVVGYTSGGDLVLSGSPDQNSRGRMFFAYLSSDDHLLNQKEWVLKYKDLYEKGRVVDPKANPPRSITSRLLEDKNYEVPTIDSAPKEKSPKKPLNKRTASLVQILSF